MSRTPAPWKLEIDSDPEWAWIWDSEEKTIIANKIILNKNDKSNLLLMVVAPELLELCEKALSWFKALPWEHQSSTLMDELDFVIDKAKGGEQETFVIPPRNKEEEEAATCEFPVDEEA
jgi:hypothetical protein